jgi:hypothetical protein
MRGVLYNMSRALSDFEIRAFYQELTALNQQIYAHAGRTIQIGAEEPIEVVAERRIAHTVQANGAGTMIYGLRKNLLAWHMFYFDDFKLHALRVLDTPSRIGTFFKENPLAAFSDARGSVGLSSGADPEVFVVDKKNGEVIPAFLFLPSKQSGEGFYWDGFQAEFQVTPSTCMNAQMDNTYIRLTNILQRARSTFPNARLTAQSTVEIPFDTLLSSKPEHVALGCGASLNAYDLCGEPVADARMLRERFAGGHIHAGLAEKLLPAKARQIVKAIDAIATVPTIAMFEKLDSPARRRYYGLPGEYRLPAHGLEYRTLSSAWLCHPAIAQFTRELVRMAIKIACANHEHLFEYEEVAVVRCILDHDVDFAREHVKKNLKLYEELLRTIYPSNNRVITKGLALMSRPVHEFVAEVDNLEKNWGLGQAWVTNCGNPRTTWASYATSL